MLHVTQWQQQYRTFVGLHTASKEITRVTTCKNENVIKKKSSLTAVYSSTKIRYCLSSQGTMVLRNTVTIVSLTTSDTHANIWKHTLMCSHDSKIDGNVTLMHTKSWIYISFSSYLSSQTTCLCQEFITVRVCNSFSLRLSTSYCQDGWV